MIFCKDNTFFIKQRQWLWIINL